MRSTTPSRASEIPSEWASLGSPIGVLTVEGNEDVITCIDLPGTTGGRRHRRTAQPESEPSGALACAIEQLEEYFDGQRTEFDLPLSLSGTPFQEEVWLSLAEIPYGKTVSYAQLAQMVGRPKAYRAVGQANGSNPIPIVLPCHRVLASGGTIGGYGGGLAMKRKLLALEGAIWLD